MNTLLKCFTFLLLISLNALHGKDLIENGDFNSKKLDDDWKVQMREGYSGELKIKREEKGVMRIKTGSASNHSYAVVTQNIELKAGKTYKVVLEVQATGDDKVMRASINWNYPEHRYTDGGYSERIKLTKDEWIRAEYTFTATEPEAKDEIAVFNLQVGKLNHDLLVRKISILQQ